MLSSATNTDNVLLSCLPWVTNSAACLCRGMFRPLPSFALLCSSTHLSSHYAGSYRAQQPQLPLRGQLPEQTPSSVTFPFFGQQQSRSNRSSEARPLLRASSSATQCKLLEELKTLLPKDWLPYVENLQKADMELFLTAEGQRAYFKKKLASSYAYAALTKSTIKGKLNRNLIPCSSSCGKSGSKVARGGTQQTVCVCSRCKCTKTCMRKTPILGTEKYTQLHLYCFVLELANGTRI